MGKRKIGNVLWLALQCAKRDRQSFIDAYHGDTSVEWVREAQADIKAFERLQIKLFGTDKSELQAKIAKMKSVNILKLLAQDLEAREEIIREISGLEEGKGDVQNQAS